MGQLILIGIAVWFGVAVIAWLSSVVRKVRLYDKEKTRLDQLDLLIVQFKLDQERWSAKVKEDKQAMEILAKEKCVGFPWLATAYADYLNLQEIKVAESLEQKNHPARRAAEIIRESAARRRSAEKLSRINEYQLEYYETLFPWLSEFRNEEVDELEQLVRVNQGDDSDEKDDPAKRWLTQAEFNSLSSAEKYQLALDRYWQKKKSKWEVGRDYERFIGYQYEIDGWQVSYHGIVEGFDDLGRDLIVRKGDKVHIIQCKYWSQHKTIHEKHVFQLYGSAIAYKIDNPMMKVFPFFVTATSLSDRARLYANELKIEVKENVAFQAYPCIKCNVSRANGAKIYHLPFDQQYDRTTIIKERNEHYALTIAEAEAMGFRRAFRWRGKKEAGV